MPTLVPIPWQRHLYLTPHTLSYLVAASRRLGRNLYLYDRDYKRISPAWRSFKQQLTAWLRWLSRTGPVASSPYTGNRTHMRGAAFDLRETSASVQAACRAVGLIRDPDESWHWNDPLWRSMPIIKSLPTSTSGGTTSPLPNAKDIDMRIIYNTGEAVDDRRRIIVGELSFQHITKAQATREVKLYGAPVNFSPGETTAELASVNSRRAAIGQPPIAP